jgi:5'-nucleotidase
MKKSVRLFSLVAVLVLLMAAVGSAGAKPSGTVSVQILAVNDFHGNLEPPPGSSGRIGTINAGGSNMLLLTLTICAQQIPIRSWFRQGT